MNPRLTADELETLLRSLPDPAFVLTESGLYAAIYGGTDKRYYHDGSSLIGKKLHDVLKPDKVNWFMEQVRLALDGRGLHVVEYELSNRDVLGLPDEGPTVPLWFEGRITPLPFTFAMERAVLWVASNITERHQLEIRLREQSETDELTGLFNRRRLMLELTKEFNHFVRYGQPASVVFFDIDRFKLINDDLGHHMGDEALRVAAQATGRQLRRNDVAARFGGDEFVVLCSHTNLDEVRTFAQRLLDNVQEVLKPFAVRGRDASISVGCSSMRENDTSLEDVLHRADDAQYRAKRQGGGQVMLA